MVVLEPRQRTVFGWQIRWVAGLFSLLMFAAGVVPASAREPESFSDASLGVSVRGAFDESRSGALLSTADAARATSGDLLAPSRELLGSKSSSDSDLEEYEPDLSALPAFQLVLFSPSTDRVAQIDAGLPNGIDAAGRPSPRAPPLT